MYWLESKTWEFGEWLVREGYEMDLVVWWHGMYLCGKVVEVRVCDVDIIWEFECFEIMCSVKEFERCVVEVKWFFVSLEEVVV